MRLSTSNLGAVIVAGLGIMGIYLITKPKTPNKPSPQTSSPDSSNLQILYFLKSEEDKEAEIIGNYIAHGIGGSVFRLPSGDVMKVVSLENDMIGEGGNLNRDQSAFIETVWLKQLANENAFIDDFAEIKHYHRGYAGPRLAQLVNSESPAYQKRPLKVGERIAYWVMEYIPTIGKGEMTEARIRGAKNRIEKWGDSHGYTIHDLHEANFGMRKDGSFVAFDPWPTKN
jgi:hypothetical protein